MEKSPDAFRTISEVADSLETPAHVLRFWESRFPQIRPVKRAGGRRYYRPSDVALLSGIKRLLHDEGMTIRGVQKILREQGIRHVARLGSGEAFDTEAGDALEAQLSAALGVDDAEEMPHSEAESAQIIALETVLNRAPPNASPVSGSADERPVQAELWSDSSDDAVDPDDIAEEAAAAGDPSPAPVPASEPLPEAVPEAPMVELADSEESAVVTIRFSGGTDTRHDDDATGPGDAAAESNPEHRAPADDVADRDASPEATHDAPQPDDHAGRDTVSDTVVSRLRALPRGALVGQAEAVGVVQDRILSLRARLADSSRRRRR